MVARLGCRGSTMTSATRGRPTIRANARQCSEFGANGRASYLSLDVATRYVASPILASLARMVGGSPILANAGTMAGIGENGSLEATA